MVQTQMIHYVSPYSREKNIGGAINAAIRQLNADPIDWVVLTDHDVLWLLPDSKAQVESILLTTEYDILGPVTNRLAKPHQLHKGAFDIWDVRQQIEIAQDRQRLWRSDILPTREVLAAFCLCFRVSTWQRLGGFVENSIQFDTLFCRAAVADGLKLGIMRGVYLFHLYRALSRSPKQEIAHLLIPAP